MADGRDMGTVVFPDAEVKIFLTADLEERAFRRFLEREKGAAPGMRNRSRGREDPGAGRTGFQPSRGSPEKSPREPLKSTPPT